MLAIVITAIVAASHAIQIDVGALNFAAGVVVPLLVGLLSKLDAPSGLKAVLNLLLSAVLGALTTAIEAEGAIQVSEWAVGIGMTWVISIVSYYGLWVPTKTAPKLQVATRNVGVG